MELSKELYLRRHWKVEEILLLLFEGRESVEIKSEFYDEEDPTIHKSRLEKAISKAIKSEDLKEYKALDDDNSDYLNRYEISNWLFAHKPRIDINERLYGRSLEFQFDEEPDYLDFSDRVYGGGTFTRHEAFCYLRGIPEDKTTWSDDDIRKHPKFDAYENHKERLNYEEILVIAGKASIGIPEEMQIIIEEVKKFGAQDQPVETGTKKPPVKRSTLLHELIDEEDIKLEEKLGRVPKAREVWNQLKSIQGDRDNCITKIKDQVLHSKGQKREKPQLKYNSFYTTLGRIRNARAENKKAINYLMAQM